LFLDELPEFGQSLLEILRQPLEDKTVTISRARGSLTFPANFMLVGAMNPCPCGYYGDPYRQCTCNPGLVSRYQKRISGPFLDRIDIFIEVPHIDYEKLSDDRPGERSENIRERVSSARSLQYLRFKGSTLTTNSEMPPADVRNFCKTDESAQSLLKAAMKQMNLSARAFHRILKLARTIADLENSAIIKSNHIAEAIQYRPRRTVEII
jgi:magnesium chelatase family protein